MLGRKRERSTWAQRAILIGACLTYVLGYAAVRSDHFLVHGISLAESADGQGAMVIAHDIRPGDFGVPELGPATAIAMQIAGVIYWPLSKAELGFWYLVEPVGSLDPRPRPSPSR